MQQKYWNWLEFQMNIKSLQDLYDNADGTIGTEETGITFCFDEDRSSDEQFWVEYKNGVIESITGLESVSLVKTEFQEEVEKQVSDFKGKANEHATLQDFVMYLLGNNIIELDFENPFYKGEQHAE